MFEQTTKEMGNCGGSMTPEEKQAKKKSQEIEQELSADRKRIKEEVKLLLLGMLSSNAFSKLHLK